MLKAADYRGVLAVLETVEQAPSLKAFRTCTLDALEEHLGYQSSAFLIGGAGARGLDGVLHGQSRRGLDRSLARWSGNGALASKANQSLFRPNEPIDLEDIYRTLPPDAAREVSEFLRPKKIGALMAVPLDTHGPTRALVTLLSARGRAFGANDRERLLILAPHLGNLLRQHLRRDAKPSAASSLTPREVATVDLVAAGYSNRQIARQLQVTESTVKKHVSASLTKLGVSSRTQLTLAWLAGERSGRRAGRHGRPRGAQQASTARRASATRST